MKAAARYSPVPEHADQNLADDDAANLEILDRGNPGLGADFERLPAGGEAGLKEGLEVPDGEEHISTSSSSARGTGTWGHAGSFSPFQAQAGAGQDHVPEVVREGAERVGLEHGPDAGQLAPALFGISSKHKLDLLHQRHVGPVDAGGIVVVVGTQQIVEDLLLLGGHVITAGGVAVREGMMLGWGVGIVGHHDAAAHAGDVAIARHDALFRELLELLELLLKLLMLLMLLMLILQPGGLGRARW